MQCFKYVLITLKHTEIVCECDGAGASCDVSPDKL